MKRKYLLLTGLLIVACFSWLGIEKFPETGLAETISVGIRPFAYKSGYLLGPPVVAVVRCTSYNPEEVKKAVEEAVSLIGGLDDIVRPGDRIGIKPNLTTDHPGESGVTTHPEIISALIDCLRKITKGEIIIMEGSGGADTMEVFKNQGWVKLCRKKGVKLVDLNHPAPYADFGTCRVPGGGLVFQELAFNKILKGIDVFVSAAKLKVHELAGVTLCLKNQFGSVPIEIYGKPERAKMELHGEDPWYRVPRAINDINLANPINLALIDGVIGLEGGAGLWNEAASPKKSGVIILGKNAVAVDAVGTILMGYNPRSDYPVEPFKVSENHLRIACDLGLGPTDLNEIELKLGKGIKRLSDLVSFYSISYARYEIPTDFRPEKVNRLLPPEIEKQKKFR